MVRPQPLVLVVDDTEDDRLILGGTLEFSGYRVVEATDGEEAVHKARLLTPDAILMDIKMPRMDGLAATRRLREEARTTKIPIIMITAYGSEEHERMAANAGCFSFLEKPIHPHQLLIEVRKAIEK